MKITPAFGPMSGKLGGVVASRNRSGAYFRAKAIPVNPSTNRQQIVRAAMTNLVQAWRDELTEQQREAWRVYAQNVPVTDRLGQTINLTGQNHYIRSNTPRTQAGLARVDDAPTIFNTGEVVTSTQDEADEATVNVIVLNNAEDAAQTQFNFSAPLSGAATLLIYAGNPVNPSVNFYKGPYQLVDAPDGALEDDETFPWNAAEATWQNASPLAVGQRRSLRVRLSYDDGRLSAPFELLAPVVQGASEQ